MVFFLWVRAKVERSPNAQKTLLQLTPQLRVSALSVLAAAQEFEDVVQGEATALEEADVASALAIIRR